MRVLLYVIACCFIGGYVDAQVITLKDKGGSTPGTWYCFRNTVDVDETPREV